jgi:hypothetical protein
MKFNLKFLTGSYKPRFITRAFCLFYGIIQRNVAAYHFHVGAISCVLTAVTHALCSLHVLYSLRSAESKPFCLVGCGITEP